MGRAAVARGRRLGPRNAAADKAVRFINNLTHTKGAWAGQPFNLRRWQETLIRCLFGTLLPDGSRQYRTCYVEIPRKNGKTELAAAIALYLLMGDGEAAPEVYGAAVDLEQASLAYAVAAQMIRNDPELLQRVEVIASRKRIVHYASGGFYRAIPADAPSAHGYNTHGLVYDELHAAPDRELWDVLTTSQGSRRQPLTVVITTAGYDKQSICWELHTYAEKVRDGLIPDPTFLPVIYGAPPTADWLDERVWHQVNPALGDFRSLEEMRMMARQAKEIPARQNTFRRLYLNQWTESETRWLDGEAWVACAGPVPWPDLEAHLVGRRAWLGLDLSSTTDLTAAALVVPDDVGGVDVAVHCWLPEERLRQRVDRDRVPYDLWARQGALTLTPGNVVDYAHIRAWVKARASRFRIQEVCFDPWNATGLITDLQDDGATCVEVRQGFASLSAPTKELEKLVSARQLRHGGQPVLAWAAANVVVRQDPAGNLKPDKAKSTERIDPIVAVVTALARCLVAPDASSRLDRDGEEVLIL